MKRLRPLTLVLLGGLCLATSAAADDAAALKQSIMDIRNIGTAAFSWFTDQPQTGSGGTQSSDNPKTFDLSVLPLISHADLEKLLVPQYLARLPANDPWGNPYEFRLNRADLRAKAVMSIRSAGKDGRFATDNYTIGAYATTDYDHDIVWADGYFICWPQGPK